MRYIINVPAGATVQQPLRGQNLVLADAGAAGAVSIGLVGASAQDVDQLGEVGKGFSLYLPDRAFTGVELSASGATVVELIVTDYRVSITDGQSLTATIDATQLPLPVQNQQGDAPANPLYVTGITYEDTPAAANANAAAVAVGDVVAAVAAASATRLELRMTNIGTDAVALGAAGLTWAQRCVILQPGDTWVEVKGAALAWYGITDAAKSASVTKQELTA